MAFRFTVCGSPLRLCVAFFVLAVSGAALGAIPSSDDGLLRMSEELDTLDKDDLQRALDKTRRCTGVRDFECAERELKLAARFSTDSRDKKALAMARRGIDREREAVAREAAEREARRQAELEEERRAERQREADEREEQRIAQARESESSSSSESVMGAVMLGMLQGLQNYKQISGVANQAAARFAEQQAVAARTRENEQERQRRARAEQERVQIERAERERANVRRAAEERRVAGERRVNGDVRVAQRDPDVARSASSDRQDTTAAAAAAQERALASAREQARNDEARRAEEVERTRAQARAREREAAERVVASARQKAADEERERERDRVEAQRRKEADDKRAATLLAAEEAKARLPQALAFCFENEKTGRWFCDGRVQYTILGDKDLAEQLKMVGCENGTRIGGGMTTLTSTRVERLGNKTGWLYDCGYKLDAGDSGAVTWNRDIRRFWRGIRF